MTVPVCLRSTRVDLCTLFTMVGGKCVQSGHGYISIIIYGIDDFAATVNGAISNSTNNGKG